MKVTITYVRYKVVQKVFEANEHKKWVNGKLTEHGHSSKKQVQEKRIEKSGFKIVVNQYGNEKYADFSQDDEKTKQKKFDFKQKLIENADAFPRGDPEDLWNLKMWWFMKAITFEWDGPHLKAFKYEKLTQKQIDEIKKEFNDLKHRRRAQQNTQFDLEGDYK